MPTHLLGIRHHGPGSAHSVLKALEVIEPDILLLEGPPEAEPVLATVGHADLQPPVALLLYVPDAPKLSVFYPFARVSPEWQALLFANSRQIPVRLIDLPQSHQLATESTGATETKEAEETAEAAGSGGSDEPVETDASEGDVDAEPEVAPASIRRDPMAWVAEAAGYTDSERFWEHLVEMRSSDAQEDGETESVPPIFAAVQELMTALRADLPAEERGVSPEQQLLEVRREAWMRQSIRAAQKEGYQRIAVVCGAWHVPALAEAVPAKRDAELLKGLPKVKLTATWAPWTYNRLSMQSGYGAGIESPGYYDQLWSHPQDVASHWMGSSARLLREEDLDASPASLIEAVRLAETLAALRELSKPGLIELMEAIRTVLCGGSETALALIGRRLVVGEVLGRVPDDTPMPPMQRDLQKEQKRLRLPAEATERALDLDLRKSVDLDRSRLLHRLALMGIDWGREDRSFGKSLTSTFHERWKIAWKPELVVNVIEAGMWGNTVLTAASAHAIAVAEATRELPALTALIERTLLAELPDAVKVMMVRLEALAGLTSDVQHLMAALPPLASIVRYGNVRGTDTTLVNHVVEGLVTRACVGLPAACSSLNDEAAGKMYLHLLKMNDALLLLEQEDQIATWHEAVARVADLAGVHGLVAGRCCRLLLDQYVLNAEEVGNRIGFALSQATSPQDAATWVEGFLRGSGLMLLHTDALWQILDGWVAGLSDENFALLLPVVRRTFSTFPTGERRQMGERAKQAERGAQHAEVDDAIDAERGDITLPTLAMLLGIPFEAGLPL